MKAKAKIKNTAEGPVLVSVKLEMRPTDLLVLLSALRLFDEQPDRHVLDRFAANAMIDTIMQAISGAKDEEE